MTQNPPIALDELFAVKMHGVKRLRIAWLPDGKRLRLSDGVIDIILQAFGRPGDISRVYDAAIARTRRILTELDAELARLKPGQYSGNLLGARINSAVALFAAYSVTPESALAGAVADDVIGTMLETAPLDRAFVNNCGRIAFHITPGHSMPVTMMDRPGGKDLSDTIIIDSSVVSRGIATSAVQWRRCGMADGLMVAAASGVEADIASTLLLTATDAPGAHWSQALSYDQKRSALSAGIAVARKLQDENLIRAARIKVQGEEINISTERTRKRRTEA